MKQMAYYKVTAIATWECIVEAKNKEEALEKYDSGFYNNFKTKTEVELVKDEKELDGFITYLND